MTALRSAGGALSLTLADNDEMLYLPLSHRQLIPFCVKVTTKNSADSPSSCYLAATALNLSFERLILRQGTMGQVRDILSSHRSKKKEIIS